MEIELLDSEFKAIRIIDVFNSLIWTDRYWVCGDFEISTIPSPSVFVDLQTTGYLRLRESDHMMVLEDVNIKTDLESGDQLILTGRSLESLMERRIVWNATTLTGNFQDGIFQLINENMISPELFERQLGIEFIPSLDPVITALTINTQFIGVDLYEAISTLCRSKEIGFKITVAPNFGFQFQLYAGRDRSYDQAVNSFVVFSPSFDNLSVAEYIKSTRFRKTLALVAGEKGVENYQVKTVVYAPGAAGGAGVGIERREMYYEPSIQRTTDEGTMTDAEYLLALQGSGKEELAKHVDVEAFDGEADASSYEYGVDYFMGDVLQIADIYGHETPSRVTEMIYSQDPSGIGMHPIFTTKMV